MPEDERPDIEAVLRALGRLPFNQRAALVMRELEGRSYSEIADTLGVSVPAVETLIFRARRSLRVRAAALRSMPRCRCRVRSASSSVAAGACAGGGAAGGRASSSRLQSRSSPARSRRGSAERSQPVPAEQAKLRRADRAGDVRLVGRASAYAASADGRQVATRPATAHEARAPPHPGALARRRRHVSAASDERRHASAPAPALPPRPPSEKTTTVASLDATGE